jgi:hypothetical protein
MERAEANRDADREEIHRGPMISLDPDGHAHDMEARANHGTGCMNHNLNRL